MAPHYQLAKQVNRFPSVMIIQNIGTPPPLFRIMVIHPTERIMDLTDRTLVWRNP